jgi:hypothetical protein
MQNSLHYSHRLLLVLMSFCLLSCTCYGMTTAEIAFNAYAFLLRGGNPQNTALNCEEFYFISVTQDSSGIVRFSWSDNAGSSIAFFFYHDDVQIHVMNIRSADNVGEATYQLDWASLAGSDTVEIEGREVGQLGDVCTTRTSVTRPEPASRPVPAMNCADLALTSPLGGMANGFQSFFWNDLEGAVSYRLNFYDAGALLLSMDFDGDTTTAELDVSRNAIGGDTPLTVELLAFDAAGNQCSQTYSIAREAAPPQSSPPTATPTCMQDPSRNGC